MSALWLNLSALAFNVGLNLLLVPRYGIVVAAAVTVASEVLILAGSYVLRDFEPGGELSIGPFQVLAAPLPHPRPNLGFRISVGGRSLVYT